MPHLKISEEGLSPLLDIAFTSHVSRILSQKIIYHVKYGAAWRYSRSFHKLRALYEVNLHATAAVTAAVTRHHE